jgi:hypothetical protein
MIHHPSEAQAPQASAPLRQKRRRRRRCEPGAAPRDHPAHGPHPSARAPEGVMLGGRGRVAPGRLAAHQPPQARQGSRPDVACVPIDSHAPRFPLRLAVRPGGGEGPLGCRIGLRTALARPLAPAPQQLQIAPRRGARDGVPEGAFDLGRDRVPRPGPGLPAHPPGRTRHNVPAVGHVRRTAPGARLPATLRTQAAQPMSLEALDPRCHGPSVAAPTLRHHLRGSPLGHEGPGSQALAQAGMGSRDPLAQPRRRTLPRLGRDLHSVHSGALWCEDALSPFQKLGFKCIEL